MYLSYVYEMFNYSVMLRDKSCRISFLHLFFNDINFQKIPKNMFIWRLIVIKTIFLIIIDITIKEAINKDICTLIEYLLIVNNKLLKSPLYI